MGALKVITEGTMKFTCPLEFNDPFDCFPYYDVSNIDQLPRLRPDLFRAARHRLGLSPAKMLEKKREWISTIRNRVRDPSFVVELIEKVGVVCLSRNALNIPMWSHYADYHRGFVVEFRIPVRGYLEDLAIATDRLVPFPVSYKQERPKINVGVEEPRELLDKLLLTKSLDWSYEEEDRVIDKDRGPGIFTYRRDDILCSVIAGMKINSDNYQVLETSVSKLAQESIPNLKLYRAQEREGEYKLEVRDHPRLTGE